MTNAATSASTATSAAFRILTAASCRRCR
jgi:hypothetical protein